MLAVNRKISKEDFPVFSLEFKTESESRINTFQQLKSEIIWIISDIKVNIDAELKEVLTYSLFACRNMYMMFRIQ